MKKNKHGYCEFNLNLNNTVLRGSDSSYELSNNTYSAFLVEYNYSKVYEEVYLNCSNDPECSKFLQTDASILN
jgi:hypothetical protein